MNATKITNVKLVQSQYAHTADLKLHIQRSHADRKDYK